MTEKQKVFNVVKLVHIIPKVWGREECFANNSKYCGKVLNIKAGWQASLHRHLKKDETFYMWKGEAQLELECCNGKIVKTRFITADVVHILPGRLHRLTAITDCVIIEASTHHSDSDVKRVEKSRKIDHGSFRKKLCQAD
jgi:mannose-6-phosphate isomerase-like protein (cupin superfamily)